jgi:hypothetical protein
MSTKHNGSRTDAALKPARLGIAAEREAVRGAGCGLIPANVGDMASIGLFLGLPHETAFSELRVQVHGPALGVSA